MDDTSNIGPRIRSFVERVETLQGEIDGLNGDKAGVFAEAKGEGLNVRILKEIVKLRKQGKDERDEHDALLDSYLRAIGMV